MKITPIASNDCGGFRPPKGHLDTQMYPECAGTETDRDIVKKTREERQKKKKKKKKAENEDIIVEAKLAQEWKTVEDLGFNDKQLVDLFIGFAKKTGGTFEGLYKGKTNDYAPQLNMLNRAVLLALPMTDESTGTETPATPENVKKAAELISIALKNIDQVEEAFLTASKKEDKKDKKDKKDSKKKDSDDWDTNPWAVCHTTVDKDKDPEKYERCVQQVKEKQAFNLKGHVKTANKMVSTAKFIDVEYSAGWSPDVKKTRVRTDPGEGQEDVVRRLKKREGGEDITLLKYFPVEHIRTRNFNQRNQAHQRQLKRIKEREKKLRQKELAQQEQGRGQIQQILDEMDETSDVDILETLRSKKVANNESNAFNLKEYRTAQFLQEAKEDGWPEDVKEGRFTEYCKREGFEGACIECAKKAMDSDDSSVRGMATFYMNTVKPKGKDASDV